MKCSRLNPQVDPQLDQDWQGRRLMRSAMLLGLLALAACAPSYKSAGVPLPASFREVSDSAPTAVTAVTAGTAGAGGAPPAHPPGGPGGARELRAPPLRSGLSGRHPRTPPSPPPPENRRAPPAHP